MMSSDTLPSSPSRPFHTWLPTPPQRVALMAFIFSGAVTAAFMAMPFFVFNQLGGGALMSGLIAGIQAAGYALTSLLSSGFVARAKNGMTWAMVGVAGFMVFICMMPAFRNPWICGALFSAAFTMSALAWPALHSWVGAEHIPAQRVRHMGLLNVAWSTGGAVGPFLAGPLYVADYRLPFVLVAGLCLLALWVIRTIPHEKEYFGLVTEEVLHQRAAHDQASEAFLFCAWCATFTAHICIGATRSVFPKRLDDIVASGQLRLFFETESWAALNNAAATRFSWLVVALGLATASAFFVMGRTAVWHHRFLLLAVIQVLTACAMWTLGNTHSLFIMLICFSVIGVNLGAAFFSSVYYGMANPARKHGRAAINEGVVGLGGLVGGIGFAWVANYAGVSFPFHAMPLLVTVIIALEILLLFWKKVPKGADSRSNL